MLYKKNQLFENLDLIMNQFDLSIDEFFNLKPIKGKTETETGEDEFGKWTKTTFKSNDGSFMVSNFERNNEYRNNTDLYKLKTKLKKSIEDEDFESAVILRDKIKILEKNEKEIANLKFELNDAIKSDNFEKAIECRDKIKSLRKTK